jgi:hypothetical protein
VSGLSEGIFYGFSRGRTEDEKKNVALGGLMDKTIKIKNCNTTSLLEVDFKQIPKLPLMSQQSLLQSKFYEEDFL